MRTTPWIAASVLGRSVKSVAWCAFFGLSLVGCAGSRELSQDERNECELVAQRLRDHEQELDRLGYGLCHTADPQELASVEKQVLLLQPFLASGAASEPPRPGSVRALKNGMAGLLKNKDPVIRCFAAMVLGFIGDRTHTFEIARLLEVRTESARASERASFDTVDRAGAAEALGRLGAKEYAPRLAELLHSPDAYDRAGAARGLGYMGAVEHAGAIAELLNDEHDEVEIAALAALAELGSKAYAKNVSQVLASIGDPEIVPTACYTLARLGAKEHAKDIAALLADRFRKGKAAKALALLGAKEYAAEIARLIDNAEPRDRCSGLVALGILGATEYVPGIAAHLEDEETFVRSYAALALLLLGDRTNAKAVVAVVETELKLPEIARYGVDARTLFRSRLDLPPVVAQRQTQLLACAMDAWERMRRPEK